MVQPARPMSSLHFSIYNFSPSSSANGSAKRSPTVDTEALDSSSSLATCGKCTVSHCLANISTGITNLLDTLLRDAVNSLGRVVELVGLAALSKTSTRELKAAKDVLAMLELQVLGAGLGLLDILALDVATSNLLQRPNRLGRRTGNILGSTGDGDGEKAGVRVDEALGVDLRARVLLSRLGKERKARGPLDLRLAAEERADDGHLGLVGAAGEGAGAREGDDHGVLAGVGNTLLTTVVLGLRAVESLGGRGTAGEELANPLGQVGVLGTVGDDGKVGLSVGLRRELGDGLGVEVLGIGGGRGGNERGAQAAVEGQAVDRVQSQLAGVGEALLVRHLDKRDDLLVEHMRFAALSA